MLQPGDLLVLEGDLGAGKTFFVRGVARALGVPSRVAVTSPTFGLVHELTQGRVPIVHADLYRLGDDSEIVELGLLDRIGNDAVVLVEWGERFADMLGPGLLLTLQLDSAGRRAVFTATGPTSERLLGALRAGVEGAGLATNVSG